MERKTYSYGNQYQNHLNYSQQATRQSNFINPNQSINNSNPNNITYNKSGPRIISQQIQKPNTCNNDTGFDDIFHEVKNHPSINSYQTYNHQVHNQHSPQLFKKGTNYSRQQTKTYQTSQTIKPFIFNKQTTGNSNRIIVVSSQITNQRSSSSINFTQQQFLKVIQFIRNGNFYSLCNQILVNKVNSNYKLKSQVQQTQKKLKEYQNIYSEIKTVITGAIQSRLLYEDQSFLFFQQNFSLLTKILIKLEDQCHKFQGEKFPGKPGRRGIQKEDLSQVYKHFIENFKLFMNNISKKLNSNKQIPNKFGAQRQELQRAFNNKLQQQKQKSRKLKYDLQRIKEQNEKLQLTKISSNRGYQQIRIQLSTKNIQLERYRRDIMSLNEQISELRKNSKSVYELNEQIKKHKREVQQLIAQKTSFLNQIYQLKSQSDKNKPNVGSVIQKMQIDKLKKQLKDKQQTLIQLKQHNYSLNKQIIQQRTQKIQIQKKLYSISDEKRQFQQSIILDQSKFLLQSSQLVQYRDTIAKYRLKNMITQFTKNQPIQFKLLYKFNKYLQSNFHQYIDHKPNLLIIIKLENNVVIGGFSSSPLQKQWPSYSGFLFSLTADRFYNLIYNKPCMTYDEYFFNFGNGELRIRQNEDTLNCNFGVSNQYFHSGNDMITNFIGGSHREVRMVGYEFYEVNFGTK